MGDWTDEFGWYDDLDRQEQEEERKARRAKLLTPPEPTQKPMHPELRKMWEDYFDKCFKEFIAAQPAPVREDWGPGPHEVHSLPPAQPAPVQEPVAWLYPEGLEALKAGKCWTAYGTKQDDNCNILVYLAAVAQKVEPVKTECDGFDSHPAAQQEYERGVIDGRQMQAQSSVDKAVNAMSQRQWRGLTDKEFEDIIMSAPNATVPVMLWQLIQDKLKEKNQ